MAHAHQLLDEANTTVDKAIREREVLSGHVSQRDALISELHIWRGQLTYTDYLNGVMELKELRMTCDRLIKENEQLREHATELQEHNNKLHKENNRLIKCVDAHVHTLVSELSHCAKEISNLRSARTQLKGRIKQLQGAVQGQCHCFAAYYPMKDVRPKYRAAHRKQLDHVFEQWGGGEVASSVASFFDARIDLLNNIIERVHGGRYLYQLKLSVVQQIESTMDVATLTALKSKLAHEAAAPPAGP